MNATNDDGLTAAGYREEIKMMADMIEDELANDPVRDMYDAVHEEVDNSHYIIYYSHNLDILRYADNEPEEWQCLVPENAGYQKVIQVMAFEVMRQDLYEELDRRGVEF